MDRLKKLTDALEMQENDSDLDYYLFRTKAIREQMINCIDSLEYCADRENIDFAAESLALLDSAMETE